MWHCFSGSLTITFYSLSMFKNYLLVAWRNLLRYKKVSVLNIAGLAIGITACLFIFMVVRYENSFDTFQPDYNRIYRVVTQTDYPAGRQYNSGVSYPVPAAMRTTFPQIEKVAAMSALFEAQFSSSDGKEKYYERKGIYFLEPAYFDMFHTKWLAGTPAVLSAPGVVVLSRTTANKYFGDWKKAMGQVLMLDIRIPVKVAGIVEDAPDNTDFPLRIILSYETFKQYPDYGYQANAWDGMNGDHQVFIQLPAHLSPEQLNKQLKDFSKFHYQHEIVTARQLLLLPLRENHFDARFSYIVPHVANRSTLQTLSFIGLLILLMAVINFINLTTAQTVERSKEMGIRKTLGSHRFQLIWQLLVETLVIVMLAIVLAVIIAQLSGPFLREIANLPAAMHVLDINNLRFLGMLLIGVTLLAGMYPAFILSGLQPLAALKKKITAGGSGQLSVRRGLVVVQFVISQVLIVATIVAMSQMHLLHDADLGFNKESLLVLTSPGKRDVLKAKLLQDASIAAVTLASNPPASGSNWMNHFYFDGATTAFGFNVDIKAGDADYLKTFDLHLVAGRNYQDGDNSAELIINESLAKTLGFKRPADAIGHTLKIGDENNWRQISGVVKDFVNNSLKDQVRPTLILPLQFAYYYTCVKIQPGHLVSTVNKIHRIWEELYPQYTYNAAFLDQSIAAFYEQEQQLTLLYKLFAGIAIFISCLGLYGLISFMTIQKRKEIGIRKILGASVNNILFLFCREFMILVVVAFVIAGPLSWFAMDRWLQNFNARVQMGADVFLTALLVSVIIALITVGHKAAKAAWANPVRSLRTD